MPHKQDAAHRNRHSGHGHPPRSRVTVRAKHPESFGVEAERAEDRSKNSDSQQHPAKRELHVRVPAKVPTGN